MRPNWIRISGARCLSTADSAAYLGIAKATLNTHVRRGRIAPFARIGNGDVFAEDTLNRFSAEREQRLRLLKKFIKAKKGEKL